MNINLSTNYCYNQSFAALKGKDKQSSASDASIKNLYESSSDGWSVRRGDDWNLYPPECSLWNGDWNERPLEFLHCKTPDMQ